MTEYFQKNLFKDISIDEYKKLLSCLDGRTKQFKAKPYVITTKAFMKSAL